MSEPTLHPTRAPARRTGREPVRAGLSELYEHVRTTTERLCAPLSPEDAAAQSMPDASPAKWHLAHTTWFFETFVLDRVRPGRRAHAPPLYRELFNSYYESVGPQHPRPRRGLLTRPSLDEVRAYRAAVDEEMAALLSRGAGVDGATADIVELGLHHEQQHQELLLTDVKHLLAQNPMRPAYRSPARTQARARRPAPDAAAPACGWRAHPGGIVEIGACTGGGFVFDNERPRHRALLRPFELARRPVTCGEVLAFVEDGGYETPLLWLSDGWAAAQHGGWKAPLYWERRDGEWHEFTLEGLQPLDRAAPAAHLSYYEADAIARWAGARLPSEAEWEAVAATRPVEGNLLEADVLHPMEAPVSEGGGPVQLFGDVWEWTASPYGPYPGYCAPEGALGEYNGKFMCNQMVLRGGSCLTPRGHVRATYRNFFHPPARWQMSGLRLARDAA